MTLLYFAYGSNLDERQMARRCPGAILVGPASVAGYRLAFRGYSLTRRGAVATLVPDPDARVHGVLYVLGDGQLTRLDRFEGFPRLYDRVEVPAVLPGSGDGARHAAVAYLLRSPLSLFGPSPSYASIIARAYERHGLPRAALRRARREAA